MNVFALIFLITSWICFFLGSSVFFQDTRNTLNRLFMLLSVVASYLTFMEFGNLQAQNPNIALMALKLSGLWPIGVALLFHFVLVATENSKLLRNKLPYLLIYGPALAFFYFATNYRAGIKHMLWHHPAAQWSYLCQEQVRRRIDFCSGDSDHL